MMLRSTWLLTYQPDCRAYVGASTFNKECFAFLISALELIRRALWATIRIEHEHESNAGRFRSICWVPPLEHRRPNLWKRAKSLVTVVALANREEKESNLPSQTLGSGVMRAESFHARGRRGHVHSLAVLRPVSCPPSSWARGQLARSACRPAP